LALFCAVFIIIIISRTAATVLAGDVRPPRQSTPLADVGRVKC